MKKKIAIIISTILLIAICSVSLVACAPSTPAKFMAEFAVGDEWTITTMGFYGEQDENTYPQNVVASDGENFCSYMQDKDGKITDGGYIMKEGEKTIIYTFTGDKWSKTDVGADIIVASLKEMKKMIVDGMLEETLDTTNLDKKETKKIIAEKLESMFVKDAGKWYGLDKDGKKDMENYMTIKSGKLSIYSLDVDTDKAYIGGEIKLSASIKLPDGAKNIK